MADGRSGRRGRSAVQIVVATDDADVMIHRHQALVDTVEVPTWTLSSVLNHFTQTVHCHTVNCFIASLNCMTRLTRHATSTQCKNTYQFKTQCKGDISHASKTAKIIVWPRGEQYSRCALTKRAVVLKICIVNFIGYFYFMQIFMPLYVWLIIVDYTTVMMS